MKYVSKIWRLWPLLLLYGILITLLFSTNPYQSSLLVVIIPFGILFLALFATFNSIMSLLGVSQRITPKKRLLLAAGIAWLPVMLLILRSIDQLTGRDALILVIFILAFLLYATRLQLQSRR